MTSKSVCSDIPDDKKHRVEENSILSDDKGEMACQSFKPPTPPCLLSMETDAAGPGTDEPIPGIIVSHEEGCGLGLPPAVETGGAAGAASVEPLVNGVVPREFSELEQNGLPIVKTDITGADAGVATDDPAPEGGFVLVEPVMTMPTVLTGGGPGAGRVEPLAKGVVPRESSEVDIGGLPSVETSGLPGAGIVEISASGPVREHIWSYYPFRFYRATDSYEPEHVPDVPSVEPDAPVSSGDDSAESDQEGSASLGQDVSCHSPDSELKSATVAYIARTVLQALKIQLGGSQDQLLQAIVTTKDQPACFVISCILFDKLKHCNWRIVQSHQHGERSYVYVKMIHADLVRFHDKMYGWDDGGSQKGRREEPLWAQTTGGAAQGLAAPPCALGAPQPLSPPFLRVLLRPENLSHREDLTKGYSRLCGAENTREKRALRRAGIRRGNSLPEGEIDAIAIVIERDIISIIIIIISTIYTAITTAAPRHRCSNSGISMNEVRKKLFTISLSGKAAHWYKLLKNGDSIDWEDIVPLFYSKFYPPSEIHKDRNRIYNFWPHDGESIAQAWGRLKSLMLKCPIHELPGNVIIDNFYARLSFQDKTLLDTSCSGSFTRKNEEFKRDLLDRIQENTEGWENDKDRESGIIYDYKCIEAFMDTDKFRNMSATYGLDSQVVANLYRAFASHYELPKKNFDKYHEPYKDKVDSSVNKCVVVETVDNVIPEAYIEKTPFPAKMKEYSVVSSAVNKSEKKPKEPEEQIKIEPAVAIVKDLVTENVEDGHIIFCEDASNIVSHPNKSKQVSVPMLSVRIGDHCYYGLCDIGASVSAIPYELYTEIMHEIGSCELEDIDVVIHLANRETISPIGIVRDVEVLCGKIKYPADFLVLGSAASDHCPIIFGRPFLNTCGAIIDCKKEKILTRFAGEPYEFNFSKFTKTPYKADLPSNDFKMEQCASIVLVPNNPLQQHLENSESEAFRKERDELEEIFLRQPILKHDLPVEDLGTTPPPKEDPVFDLKPLPDNLKYAHIDDKKIYPVIISSKLSEIEEERLLEILKKHRGAIGYTLDDLKGISPSICQHAINMEDDAKPVVEHQRRLIPKMKEVVRNEVLKLLEAGIIYPIADSRWVSPVHCVPKKGGMTVVPNDNDELIPQRIVVGYRMCIDFRKVNKVTKKDHYPLPFIDQMLERCMSAIFHGFCESIVEVFMDDFSVYGNSFDNCLRNLDKVLQRCEETNLVLNWEKCHFMVNEGIVLGHKISERGIEVDRAKVEAIEKMPYPRDVKDRKGADNPVADNLSRLENIAYDPVPVNDSFPNEQLAVIKGALPPALDLDSFPCVEEAIRVADEFCDQYRALKREVEILQEENQRLRRMLEYYSNLSTRPSPPHSGNNESLQVLVQNYKIEKLKLKEILMKRERNPSPSSPKE
ncbi:hypothetical protein QYE76_013433 [Lolium multiflorum]|uniref:DNA-directed DNA polymerase n=1 Tax=Lolium multiflorum TaxID=4521 RepID=A0AAD8X4U7_LOLMU|nr:hypothetical protein QYE76_013433 [Lolium multiflorum]